MRSFVVALSAVVMFGMTLSWAGSIESVRDLSDDINNSRKGRLSQGDITLLGVRIGRETLDNVRSQFGAVKTFREPENSESANNEICYVSANPADETRVVFGSGPMGGWTDITTFQVLSRTSAKLACTPVPQVSRSIETLSGIRLDMPLKELNSKLGSPTQQGQGFVIYSFKQPSEHPQRAGLIMLSGVDATIANGRVTSFRVFLIESN